MIRALGLALILAACGREIHHGVDAQPADTAVDVESVDNGEPPADAVKLTITRLSMPIAGVIVVFQRADSSLIQTSVTDANGRAWADMPDGGIVTAVEHVGMGLDELTTFATVAKGDALRLDMTPPGTGTNNNVAISVPADIKASAFAIQTSCGNGAADITGAGTIDLENCGSVLDVAVITLDAEGLPNGYALFAEGVSTTAPITVTGSFADLEGVSLDYINVPTQTALVMAEQSISPTRRAYAAVESAAPASGTAQIGLKRPVTAGSVLTMTTLFPTTGEIGQQFVYDWDSAATAAKMIDLSFSLLPAYATAPAFDIATHTVSWTERAGGVAPDAMRVELQVYRDDIPAGAAWRWKLAGARTNTTVAFPTLPLVNGVNFNPTSGDTVAVSDLTALRFPSGLGPVRATLFAPISHAVTAGTSGHITLQSLYVEQL